MRPADARPSPAVAGRLDLVVLVGLAVVTVAFLLAWPRKLGTADESYLLYEAKRLSDGEVMYRDVFDFITPLAHYVMAMAYRLFGATLQTARVVMAIVLASAVCLVYLAARRLGVRPTLATAPALALVAFGYPTFPEASPHWFATALMALLVLGLVSWRWDVGNGPAFALGVVDGTIISMQQQKGTVLGIGLAAILVLVALASRQPGWMASLVRRLGALAVGAVLVAGVVLGGTVLVAGVAPVFDAVVRYPLESYAPAMTVRWGGIAPFMERRAIPATLLFYRWLPLALLVPIGRALAGAGQARRARLALVVFAASSAIAIAYYPDFIHIAFIAPAFLVGAADSLEWLVARLPERVAMPVAAAIGALLLAGVGWRASDTLAAARAETPITADTAFGVVDLAAPWQAQIVDRLRRELDAAPSRALFCYPQMAAPYLLAGGKNPTPFQMFNAPAAPPAQIERLLAALAKSPPTYVVTNPFLITRPQDPIARWIEANYEPLSIPEVDVYADLVHWWIYRRRDSPGGDD